MSQGHVIKHISKNHKEALGLSDPLDHVTKLEPSQPNTQQNTQQGSQPMPGAGEKPGHVPHHVYEDIDALRRELAAAQRKLDAADSTHAQTVRALESRLRFVFCALL